MKLKTLTAATAVALLAGCTAIPNIRDTDRAIATTTNGADRAIDDKLRTPGTTEKPVVEVVTDAVWVDTSANVQPTAADAPVLSCPITYAPKEETVKLAAVVARIAETCHLPVRVSNDAVQLLSGAFSRPQGAAAASGATQGPPPQYVPSLSNGAAAQNSNPYDRDKISIQYNGGPVSGLLDAVTAQLGLTWKYDPAKGAVSIYYFESRSFSIASITQTSGIDSSVQSGGTSGSSDGSGGGSGGSGGSGSSGSSIGGTQSSQSTTSVKVQTDLLTDLTNSVKNVLSKDGNVSISPSFGTITITDTPDGIERGAAVIARANDVLGRQVELDVRTTVVNLTNADALGLNLTALFKDLARNFQVTISSNNATAPSGASSFGGTILQGNSKWSGSEAVFQALSTQGNIVSDTTTPITTQNLQVTPIQIGASTGYIANSQIGQTQGAGQLQSLQGADVVYGYNMFTLPYVQDDRKTVFLKFGMNLSDLKDIRHMGTDTNYIERPEQSLSNLQQSTILQSGQTLMAVGYVSNVNKTNWQGNGGAKFVLFGGGAATNNSRQVVVVTITPKVLR